MLSSSTSESAPSMPASDDAPSASPAPASAHRLAFSRLGVKRLYGIEHNVAIDALCDGINILYGPNASGKTTLARAVEHVIWPDGETGPTTNGHPVVSAAFHLGGASWRVDVDGSRCRYERDHQPTGRPAFPSAAHRDRYHLYLPDLLAATDGDADFARRILQEAQGGVDVRGAAGDLGWTDIPTSNKGTTARTLDTLQTQLREAKAKQNDLRDRERDLSRLRDRLEEAQQAATRAQVLQQAIAVAEARAAHDEAKTALASFPDAMEHVRDDDVDVLERLQDTLRSAEQTIEDNTERVEDAEATLRESILPDEGLSAGEKQTLQATVDRLKEQHTELQRITERLRGKEDEEHEAWERLSVGTDRERAAQIRLPALSEVERHARKANGLRARKDALEHVAGRLADDRAPPSVQALRDGLRHLSRWLQAPDDEAEPDSGDAAGDGSPGLSLAAAGLGIAVAILGGVLLVTTGSLVLGIALIVIGLALVGLEVARRGSGDDDATSPSEGQADRSVFEAEFQRTGLEPPSSWTREPVEAAIDDLLERLQDAAIAAAKAEEKKQLEREQAEADEQHAALHAERSELAEQIGLVPDVSSHALPWLVGRLRAWQTAYDAMTGLRGQRKAAQEKQAEILEQLNARLAAYSLDGVSTVEAAAGAVAELEAARDTFEAAVRQRDEAQREIERAASEKETARENIEALYARLDLDAGDEDGLRSLVSQHNEYKAAKEKERERRTVLKTQQQALETKDAYTKDAYGESLEEASKETLAEQLQKAEAQAGREEALREEIAEIEHQVKTAREGSTVKQLRAEYEATRDKLARRRHKDYQAAVGNVLAAFVRDQTQTESLPQVFRRARELFAEITRHRYKLALDFDNATFRAVDTVRDRGFALDALSSGTKVQLLLAVRVAFVEQQEQGPRLPLVLDETLANSDGEKARAMIDAIGTLCQATGRQVFYLTAQEDEVRKWVQQMADRDIPCEVKTLTGDRPDVRRRGDGGGDGTAVPVPATTVDTEALRGRSHDALKEALSVPDWTPRDPVASLHLWYLVEDPDALLDLMARGVKTWGQLRFQYQRSGPSVTPLPDADDRRVQALAKALQSWTDAWEVGRGQPVDRAVLKASGAVTENFIDGVSDLAADLNGDAEALLHELRERSDERAKRFHSSKADKLEAYCEANGYIDPRATYDREAMWQHVVADVSDEMEAGVLTRERMQTLFERVRISQ